MSQPDTSRGPRGRGRSIKVSQTARPRLAPLAKLGKERFRLVWLGEIHRPVGDTLIERPRPRGPRLVSG